jgi:hypothetical protein
MSSNSKQWSVCVCVNALFCCILVIMFTDIQVVPYLPWDPQKQFQIYLLPCQVPYHWLDGHTIGCHSHHLLSPVLSTSIHFTYHQVLIFFLGGGVNF